MPTIQLDGIDFELALADGEVLDVTLDSREEFLEAHGDAFADPDYPDADPNPTDAEILSWASDHLSDKAQRLIDWPLWSEADCNGVSNRDFLRGAR